MPTLLSISKKIAIRNKQINTIEQGGGHANELRDQRSVLVDKLSQIVDVKVTESKVQNSNYPDMDTGATYYQVYINGQILVDTYEHNTLDVVSRELDQNHNQSDIDGLYEIVWTKDGNKFNATPSGNGGELKAMFEVRDGNNNENLHGTVSNADATSITINKPTITNINELNMPTRGSIDVNNKEYTYNSFSYKTDANGNIETVTFYLNQTLTVEEQGNVISRKLQVGDDVDYMGIPYYHNQMNLFLRNFCEAFNKIEIGTEVYDASGNVVTDIDVIKEMEVGDAYYADGTLIGIDEFDSIISQIGVDLNGDMMNAFFIAKDKIDLSVEHQMREGTKDTVIYSAGDVNDSTKKFESYYLLTAKNVTIAKESDKDAAILSTTTYGNYTAGVDAAHLVVELQKLQNKTKLFRGGGGDAFDALHLRAYIF